jgi:small-conductance mechanosensitive channel
MKTIKTTCCKTKFVSAKKVEATSGSMSFLSTFLLIIIPKCPLCLTAYMSAMVLFFDIEYATLVPVLLHTKPVMGLLIITMILINWKDKRTVVALVIAGLALTILVLKTYFALALSFPDWLIYTAFIFSIWYNGNFHYFYRFLKSKKSEMISSN